MFGYNYKYEMNASKNVIKLRPTTGTMAKAFLPSLLFGLGTLVMLASLNSQPTVDPDPMLFPDNE